MYIRAKNNNINIKKETKVETFSIPKVYNIIGCCTILLSYSYLSFLWWHLRKELRAIFCIPWR